MELVADAGGVAYYDDSKGTNVGAVVAALEGFPRPVVLIAGGRDKGGDYAPLAAALGRVGRAAVVIGEAADKIAAALRRRAAGRARRDDGRRGRRRAPRWPSPATRWCCRRPAPASTCSATTRTAPRCSARPSRASPRAGAARREAAGAAHGRPARGQPGHRRAQGARRRRRGDDAANRVLGRRARGLGGIARLADEDDAATDPARRARSGPARSASIACWSARCWRWRRSAMVMVFSSGAVFAAKKLRRLDLLPQARARLRHPRPGRDVGRGARRLLALPASSPTRCCSAASSCWRRC